MNRGIIYKIMKSRFIKLVVLAVVFVMVGLAFAVFMVRVDEDLAKTHDEAEIEYAQKAREAAPADSKEVIDGITGDVEVNDPARLHACLIALLGSETILKIQNNEMEITPAIEKKIEECIERVKEL